ncbi:MAG: hypothetical protein ABJB05_16385 [Parafilimonas sp.]
MEKTVGLRQYGYQDFFVDFNKPSVLDKSNIYKCCSGSSDFFSNYDKLAGKYFKVLDVLSDYALTGIFLKLEQVDTKEICYFLYSPDYNTSFPFIVVGFYEKLKQRFIGKNFVLANKMIDDNLKFKTGDAWKCIDVAIIDGTYDLSVVLQNDVGSKTSLNFDYFFDTLFSTRVIPLQKAEIYKRKFGISNWNLILQTNVAIGMTEEMAIFSWGEPKKINKTITSNSVSEQWVYDGDYLYFRNGKLYAIQ